MKKPNIKKMFLIIFLVILVCTLAEKSGEIYTFVKEIFF